MTKPYKIANIAGDGIGESKAAAAIMTAIEAVMAGGPRTPDMGGAASTQEVGRAIKTALG